MNVTGKLVSTLYILKTLFVGLVYTTVDVVKERGGEDFKGSFILFEDYTQLLKELENSIYCEMLLNLIKDGRIAFLDVGTMEQCMINLIYYFNVMEHLRISFFFNS